jgi:hypothetical protein
MHSVKSTAVTIIAFTLLTVAPQARAQSTDDLAMMQTFLGIMKDYFSIFESTHDVSADSEKAAIQQMMKIQEVYDERGEKAKSTTVLRNVLKESRNQTIRNAAYMLLGDTLKETGRTEDALEALQEGLNENIRASQ